VDGEAKRNDAEFAHVAVWEHQGDDHPAALHKETLSFDNVHLAQRSYK
jgi:succinate dehydrogenase / fumarate reductase flavoprotein subunit